MLGHLRLFVVILNTASAPALPPTCHMGSLTCKAHLCSGTEAWILLASVGEQQLIKGHI